MPGMPWHVRASVPEVPLLFALRLLPSAACHCAPFLHLLATCWRTPAALPCLRRLRNWMGGSRDSANGLACAMYAERTTRYQNTGYDVAAASVAGALCAGICRAPPGSLLFSPSLPTLPFLLIVPLSSWTCYIRVEQAAGMPRVPDIRWPRASGSDCRDAGSMVCSCERVALCDRGRDVPLVPAAGGWANCALFRSVMDIAAGMPGVSAPIFY